jgi:hypothetical protein
VATRAEPGGYGHDATTRRLARDHFDAASDPYWFERNYTAYDELGNLVAIAGSSQPGDLDLDEAYSDDPDGNDGNREPRMRERDPSQLLHGLYEGRGRSPCFCAR